MSIIEGVVVGAETGGFYTTEIEQSLRFNDDDGAYLSWTPASAGNRKTWTFSTWVKSCKTAAFQHFFDASPTSGAEIAIRFRSTDTLQVFYYSGGYIWNVSTKRLFRDPSAWYHITVAFDTTQATASDRIKLYVNGELQTDLLDTSYPTLNGEYAINNNIQHFIGRVGFVDDNKVDGYLAETHFIDGTAYDATAFGEFKNGVWIAKAPDVTYGSNGFYLDFSNGASIGADSSGNGNNWTATNLASTDVMLDSPTNNFATFNPLHKNTVLVSGRTESLEGNLVSKNTAENQEAAGTFGVSSGRWYFEGVITATSGTSATDGIGFHVDGAEAIYRRDANFRYNGSQSAYGASWAVGDIIGIALDLDSTTISFYKNNVSQGSAKTDLPSGTYIPYVYNRNTSTTFNVNFGQDSSFAGNKTPQGYTDANGIGDFYYAPPAGYLALCTANLPEPAIGPNSATTADENFNTVLWTGNGSTQSISVGFQPDTTWLKKRNTSVTGDHMVYDSIRGATKYIWPNLTNAEGTLSGTLDSFDSDGFTVGGNAYVNNSGDTYVAWNWKADNTSGSTNTDGTITSTVSANVDAGFSIVSYTGTGANATVGHGLSQAPDMVIVKRRDSTSDWSVYHSAIGPVDTVWLNLTSAKVSFPSGWNSTAPTGSVFSIGTAGGTNASGGTYVAYAFSEVEGYSKFGSYTGNGSADGPFIFTNFRPAFVMVKRTDSTSDWLILDNRRGSFNVVQPAFIANGSNAEFTSTYADFLANGFKFRDGASGLNVSGGSYIYMAFAENPFKYSNAR